MTHAELRPDRRADRPRRPLGGRLALVLAAGLCWPFARAHAADPLIQPDAQPGPKVVRTAVIGGMMLTGLWPEIVKMFEKETDYQVVVVETGPRPLLDAAMRAGKADLLTMHSGDITTNLVADGYGVNMRPWARNDIVIMGPKSDPAGIRGLKDGAEALRRIAQAQANWVDALGVGKRETAQALWRKAGIEPQGDWVIPDESQDHLDLLRFAAKHNAYAICGRHPVVLGKLPSEGMEIMVEQDPLMRRPYIVMEANPAQCPGANAAGARALADFLLSEKIQAFLLEYGKQDLGDNAFDPVAGPGVTSAQPKPPEAKPQ
jgi:tungstate transport system substrate-binding protein